MFQEFLVVPYSTEQGLFVPDLLGPRRAVLDPLVVCWAVPKLHHRHLVHVLFHCFPVIQSPDDVVDQVMDIIKVVVGARLKHDRCPRQEMIRGLLKLLPLELLLVGGDYNNLVMCLREIDVVLLVADDRRRSAVSTVPRAVSGDAARSSAGRDDGSNWLDSADSDADSDLGAGGSSSGQESEEKDGSDEADAGAWGKVRYEVDVIAASRTNFQKARLDQEWPVWTSLLYEEDNLPTKCDELVCDAVDALNDSNAVTEHMNLATMNKMGHGKAFKAWQDAQDVHCEQMHRGKIFREQTLDTDNIDTVWANTVSVKIAPGDAFVWRGEEGRRGGEGQPIATEEERSMCTV